MTVRTRIAPSPTGDPHVGTAYVALFNMAFAHSQGGAVLICVLKIPIKLRSTPESDKSDLRCSSLAWARVG